MLRGRIADGHCRQDCAIFALAIVQAFFIHGQETWELHDLSRGAERGLSGAVHQINGGSLHPCRRHLAGHRAFVDQVIQTAMIAGSGLILGKIGWPNGFMGLLRVFGFGLVDPRFVGQIAAVKAVRDCFARGRNGAVVHLDAVRTHIGDRTIFIQPLRNPHGVAGRKTKLARGFLLQCRCRKWWLRVARDRLCFNRIDGELTRLNRGACLLCLGLGFQIHLIEFFAEILRQTGIELLPLMLHRRLHRPIFLRTKRFDLALTFND